jgi:DNA invertase Pin-like site-specific DNA recombinase
VAHDEWSAVNSADSTPIIPAVIYAAKSTQDRHDSIPTQIDEAREMAAEHGWTVVDDGEYSDEGFSAYSGNRGDGLTRAEAHAARAAAEHGTVAMLVAQAHDRFARGSGDAPGAPQSLGELWHRTRRQNVYLRTVEDDEELRDEASVAAIGRRAHIDSKRKAKSVAKGLKRRRGKGLHNGGPRKFGYDHARDEYGRTVSDKALHVVEREAQIVRRIFSDYAAGNAQQAIQRALNAEGVRTTRGATWHQGTIAKILADPFYAGLVVDGDTLVPGQHPAIVELDLYQRVERLREQGRKGVTHRGGHPPARPYLFTNGHLRCGRCGGAMVPRTSTRRNPKTGEQWGKTYEAYRCLNRIRDVHACDQPPIGRAEIEDAALLSLGERAISVASTREQLLEAMRVERRVAATMLDDARREEHTARGHVERVHRDYTSGDLKADSYERFRPELEEALVAATAQRAQAELRVAELEAEGVDVDEAVAGHLADLHSAIAEHLRTGRNLDEVRFVLRRVFARFVIADAEGGQAIVAHVRPEALDELMADVGAAKRDALRLSTTDANALLT